MKPLEGRRLSPYLHLPGFHLGHTFLPHSRLKPKSWGTFGPSVGPVVGFPFGSEEQLQCVAELSRELGDQPGSRAKRADK